MKFQQHFPRILTVVLTLSTSVWTSDNDDEDDGQTQWYIFTKFEDVPRFYLQLRPQNPKFRSTALSAETKYEICWSIIRPTEGDLLKPEENVEELRSAKYKHIFKDLFCRSTYFCLRYRHKNKSKSRRFRILGVEYDEMTFICLVRNYATTKIVPYYISDYEYNVNEVARGPRIRGRFVFVDNQVYGLAEEYPIFRSVNWYMTFDRYYLGKRSHHSVAPTFDTDPICKLDAGRKVRLCSYVCTEISAACFVGVTVESCLLKQFFVLDRSYHGWMLTCKIEDEEYRYVTRSYSDNEVFVLKADRGKLKLNYNMIHVSVVVDSTKK